MAKQTAEVTIKGQRFRLRPLDARAGAWMLNLELSGVKITKDEHYEIQSECLACVSLVRDESGIELTEPVITGTGKLVASLANDSWLVWRLVSEVRKVYVMDPFFAEAKAANESASSATSQQP